MSGRSDVSNHVCKTGTFKRAFHSMVCSFDFASLIENNLLSFFSKQEEGLEIDAFRRTTGQGAEEKTGRTSLLRELTPSRIGEQKESLFLLQIRMTGLGGLVVALGVETWGRTALGSGVVPGSQQIWDPLAQTR